VNSKPGGTTGVRDWKLITQEERENVEFLVRMQDAYEKAFPDDVKGKPDYVRIQNQVVKLRKRKEDELKKLELKKQLQEADGSDYTKMTDAEKWELARSLLNPAFRRFVGSAGTTELIKIKDEENKLVAKIMNPKAMREQLSDAIADHCVARSTIYAPWFIEQLVKFWERYGDSIDKFDVYGGFQPNTWCLGRALCTPVAGDMPTWSNFIARMNDPEAFAAWIYGVASKRYRGRQILWLKGANGEDGKTYIQRLIVENLFPNVAHAMANSAFSEGSARFIGAEFENKALAYWDDCNNTMALFREDVKMLSSGSEGAAARIEHKGVMAYQAQLEARMWINSNYSPSISHDNFVRSRLLYIVLDPMQEEPDIAIGKKFQEELPSFLAYGQKAFEKLCKDGRRIVQSERALVEIEDLADNFEEQYQTIFATDFVLADREEYVTCRSVRDVLTREGLKDNHKQSDFYRWLEKRKGLHRKTLRQGDTAIKVLYGVKLRTLAVIIEQMQREPLKRTATEDMDSIGWDYSRRRG